MAEIKLSASKLVDLVPDNSAKTVVFCEVEKTSYEVFFYTFFDDGKWVQSNELVDQEQINNEQMDEAVEQLIEEVRLLEMYNPEKRNVITGILSDKSLWNLEQMEKTVGLYKIKKDWKARHIL